MDKSKKRLVIFSPAPFLASPCKPKIQYVYREKIKDFCQIGMELLLGDSIDNNEEAMAQFKEYATNKDNMASFDSFQESNLTEFSWCERIVEAQELTVFQRETIS